MSDVQVSYALFVEHGGWERGEKIQSLPQPLLIEILRFSHFLHPTPIFLPLPSFLNKALILLLLACRYSILARMDIYLLN